MESLKCESRRSGMVIRFILLIFFFTSSVYPLDDGLALTPPMGWNSWNTFRMDISEDLIKEVADAFIVHGLKEAGYEFIVIDDGWQKTRDNSGNILADDSKFPSGMKSLAEHIHAKGLKFGLYSDAGTKTCGGLPGSRGYEFQDARQYASWGVDYLKYDWCHSGNQSAPDCYRTMSEALQATGRPIVFSMCEWGLNRPWLWGKDIAHLWRTTLDIRPCWDCGREVLVKGMPMENFMGFTKILDKQVGLETYAGPGHWNDPDMLEVGNGDLTYEENKAHFSLWCILAAPLILGNDVRNMTAEILEIVTNKEVIAVNQDPLGRQGRKIRDGGDLEVWEKQLFDGKRAIVLFNRSEKEQELSISWNEIGYPADLSFTVRDLWQKKDLGEFKALFTAKVPAHGVIMLKIG